MNQTLQTVDRRVAVTHPLRAWGDDPTFHRDQLVHAVDPGQYVAACGVIVHVVGEPWPDPNVSTPLPRCPDCSDAVGAAWRNPSA